VRLRSIVPQEGKEEEGHGRRARGCGELVGDIAGRLAGGEQKTSCCSVWKELLSCTGKLKPLMKLLHLDCLPQFTPIFQTCK